MRRVTSLFHNVRGMISSKSGQGSAEYALIILLVAIAIIGAVSGVYALPTSRLG